MIHFADYVWEDDEHLENREPLEYILFEDSIFIAPRNTQIDYQKKIVLALSIPKKNLRIIADAVWMYIYTLQDKPIVIIYYFDSSVIPDTWVFMQEAMIDFLENWNAPKNAIIMWMVF